MEIFIAVFFAILAARFVEIGLHAWSKDQLKEWHKHSYLARIGPHSASPRDTRRGMIIRALGGEPIRRRF